MATYYFTFMQCDPEHKDNFVKIEAPDYASARTKMFNMFGKEWGFQYDEESWIIDTTKTDDYDYLLRDLFIRRPDLVNNLDLTKIPSDLLFGLKELIQ